MVNIITDSTADLGPALAQRFKIRIVPLYVVIADQVYTDGVTIHLAQLFESVAQTGQLPKTSAPSVPDFIAAFDQPGESVYISLSSQISATYQNALLAQQSFEPGRVFVIDSRNLTTGIGLLALHAADLRDQGFSAADIAAQISTLVTHVRTSFVIETLDYLHKGGRLSSMQSLMGSLLHIRPVIAVREDGTLGVKSRTRGSRRKALTALLDDFREHLPEINLERVFIVHTGCDADVAYLKSELMGMAPNIGEIFVTHAGSVIGSHCGPGTIAIPYILK